MASGKHSTSPAPACYANPRQAKFRLFLCCAYTSVLTIVISLFGPFLVCSLPALSPHHHACCSQLLSTGFQCAASGLFCFCAALNFLQAFSPPSSSLQLFSTPDSESLVFSGPSSTVSKFYYFLFTLFKCSSLRVEFVFLLLSLKTQNVVWQMEIPNKQLLNK